MARTKDKQPWFKFYPQDWRGDAKLRMCSIGARGLWAEMLCVMHEADPYGYLLSNGNNVTSRQMAVLAGISQGDCMKYLLELASAGVYSIDENKTIFSRRMVRDKAKAERDKQNGKGGGNPELVGADNRGVNPPVKGKDKAQKLEARFTETETRASACQITPEAFEITGSLERACGFNLPEETPVGWSGCAMWVQKCLNEGWVGEVMIDAASATARRKRNGFIESYRYLEKPLAEAMAVFRQPLPIVEVRQPEKHQVTAHGKPPAGNVIQAIDRLNDKLRSFDSGPGGADEVCGGEGKVAPRLLSQG